MNKTDKNQNTDTPRSDRVQLHKKSKALLLRLMQESPLELVPDRSILPLLRHGFVRGTFTITPKGRKQARALTKELEELKPLMELLPEEPEEANQ